jgi:hypothetical protein
MYATVSDSDSPPQGRNFTGNLSASSAGSPFSVASQSTTQTVGGLQQGWTASFRYRISFGGGRYYPTDGSYLIDLESMSTITKVSPTITFVGSSGYTGLTFQVDGGNADSVSYQLQTTAGVDESGKSGTITAANYNSDFTISGLGAGTAHRLRAYGNYTSNFDPDQTSSSTYSADVFVSIKNAVAPTITLTGSTQDTLTWSVDLKGADSAQYRIYSFGSASNIVGYTNVPANGVVSKDSLYPGENYRCEVIATWSNSNAVNDQTSATRTSATTDYTTPVAPSVSTSARSVVELVFSLTNNGGGVGYYYELYNTEGTHASGFTTSSSVSVGGLVHNSSYTFRALRYDNRYRTRLDSSYGAVSTTTRPASSPTTGTQTMTNTSGSSTFVCSFASYGTGLPDGARRYYYRSSSSSGTPNSIVSSAVVTNPTTSVSVNVTRIFYYQGYWEQTYASVITGTPKAFGSNSTCGVSYLVCTPTWRLATTAN